MRIARIESFIFTLPRDTPYLGPLGPGEHINPRGYLVRQANQTIYADADRSVLVRVSADDGTQAWGETYGLITPQATTALIDDALAPLLIARELSSAAQVMRLHAELAGLMRVRGHDGGYWMEAVAALDIALWDLLGRSAGQPVAALLGGARRGVVPAYVSGLPGASLADKVSLARSFQARGFNAFKVAAAVSFDGIAAELRQLRSALGPQALLMVDLHWQYSADEAIALINQLAPLNLYFAEAPCAAHDLDGQARVAQAVAVPIALGEEWHSLHQAASRLQRRAMAFIQPEVARTGLTGFMHMGRLAQAQGVAAIPHASIGIGVYQAASLHGAAALLQVPMHEYQHSVFDRCLGLLDTRMRCAEGVFTIPSGPGLGVAPSAAAWPYLKPQGDTT